MADNSIGRKFRISSFGESHGKIIGVLIDGIPAGLDLNLEFIQNELNKRKPGQSKLTTERKEDDEFTILSGIFNNKTTGAPICLVIENKDKDSSKYEKFKHILRPSHVDYSALKRYGGFADFRGSGRFSGRITAGFVMAGAIAKQILNLLDINMIAYTQSIGEIEDFENYESHDIRKLMEKREKSLARTLNPKISEKMELLIQNIKNQKDSLGGTIQCLVKNFPAGVGGPVFNSLESDLAKGIFSIPAVKGIEFGAGFKSAKMKGSEHNDPWKVDNNSITTTKNDSGGIIGGISTGMPISFRVAIKPTASIGKKQKTVDIKNMKNIELELEGRHDPCILPRAVVIVEAITSVILVDHLICQGKIPEIINNDEAN
ncbi:MAG: chorismate synthase [Candidatus Lokiarchaeota archaeon]|nr:chorismate synthase [Candidatus Lokiarchaeota archaeon]MBD3200108.1 chorismate synthase [Candidatus Lokiarchaeota archaeon]